MTLAWGGWDVRVYAAMSWLRLAQRFAAEEPHIIEMIEAMARDPAPQVRLQIANHLPLLNAVAPDRMWRIAEAFVDESNNAVLSSFLSHALGGLIEIDPDKGEALLAAAAKRLPAKVAESERARDHARWQMGLLAAQLHVRRGRPLARTWVTQWTDEPALNGDALEAFVCALRSSLFERYRENAGAIERGISERARESVRFILERALEAARQSRLVAAGDDISETGREQAVERYRSAETVIYQACNQFYFGSGAYRAGKDVPGLRSDAARSAFLEDYASVLALLARSHEPRTHHHLIELYEYLIPGDPAQVLEAIHSLLTGQAAEEGYQFEILGMTVVVRIVRRFLADHRALFEDPDQRQRLSDVLTTFSNEGWPEALQLLYDLPDLLR